MVGIEGVRARNAVDVGELVEQGVEGGLAFAAVEGREGLVADARLGEADTGGDPGGGEVALVGLDRFQRLILRPALEPRLARARRRCRRGAGSSSAASRSESSSPFSSSSSALEGSSESKKASTLACGTAPVNSSTTVPSRKAFTAGIPWTP